MEWKDISTAPKDVDVQLFGSFKGGPGQWWPSAFLDSKSGKWVCSGAGEYGEFSENWKFSHWMHFPSPPKE
jgi:hypothetical protein